MPTVEFSAGAFPNLMGYFYGVAGSGLISAPSGSAFYTPIQKHAPGNDIYTYIDIFRGTKPTVRPTNASEHSANLLMRFTAGTDFAAGVGPVTQSMSDTTHTCQIITQFVNAQYLSGAATWFALVSNNISGVIFHWATGTVGTAGSGADLIMASTAITVGQPYKIANLTLTQSSIFTY